MKKLIVGVKNDTQTDGYSLRVLTKKFSRGEFDKEYILQRAAGCSTDSCKSGLITSVVRNEKIDSIKLCEEHVEDNTWKLWLIDGLQRLTTFEEYFNNAFAISKKQKKSIVYYKDKVNGEDQLIEYDLRGKRYRDLPQAIKDQIDDYILNVDIHLDCTKEDMAYDIERYNQNVPMNTNQKNFLCMLNTASDIKDLANNHVFFKDCGDYKGYEKPKGIIERVITEAMMLMFHFDLWSKGKKMNEILDAHASSAEFSIFEGELDDLAKIIDHDTTGQLFNSKNSFIWFAAFNKFTDFDLPNERFAEFLTAFQDRLHSECFDEYEQKSFDTYDNGKGTKDKKVVATKLDMLEKLMKDFFGLNEETEEPIIEENFDVDEVIDDDIFEEEICEKQEEVVEEKENDPVVVEESSVPTAEEIENQKTLDFIKAEVDPGAIMKDVEDFMDIVNDDNSFKFDSAVLTVSKTVTCALIAYSYLLDKDTEFFKWANDICKKGRTFSLNDRINYICLKREFDSYIDDLDGKNVA